MHQKKATKKILLIVMISLMVFAMAFLNRPAMSYAEDDPNTVSVYLSMSHDDEYFVGKKTNDVIALQHYDVPYFDLAQYGLQDFYFHTSGDPGASAAELAKGHVTMLHLYIWATEVSYYGLDPSEAGKGYLYEQGILGSPVLKLEGYAGSIFIRKIWNHNYNLNYFLNYTFPSASGMGSTCDQIELSDGDIVTLGQFEYLGFFGDPRSVFNSIGLPDSYLHATTSVNKGDTADLVLYLHGSHEPADYCPHVYIQKYEDITKNPSDGTWTDLGAAGPDGHISVDTTDLEAGEYLVALPGQPGKETTEICSTPGAIRLTVKPSSFGDNQVSINPTSFVYDGQEHEPEVTVTTPNGKVLVEGKDYTVKYSDNIQAGVDTGKVTVTGQGGYAGEITKTFTIEPKELTASLAGDISKTYDGTADVDEEDARVNIDGLIAGDHVQANASSIAYDNAKAGKHKTVTASGLTLTGADKDNYKLVSDAVTTKGDILKKDITASLNDNISKIYDGTVDVEDDDAQINLDGTVEGDDVKAEASITYEDAQVEHYKTVTASDIVLVGADKDNYKLKTDSLTTKGNILRKELVLSISGDVSKTYDGTIDAEEGDAELKVDGIVGKDDVKVTDPLFTYDNAKVGKNKTVYASCFYIEGADKNNYNLPKDLVTTTGEICPKELKASIIGDISKTYDGTSDLEKGDAQIKIDGILEGDRVELTGINLSYEDANAGKDKTVTASGLTLAGADKDNYVLSSDSLSIKGEILPKEITASIKGDISKIYDGTDDVEKDDVELHLDGILEGDNVKLDFQSAKYEDAKVGNDKAVMISGLKLTGPDKDNYKLASDNMTTTGDIQKKPTIQVNYDANGGSGKMAPVEVERGSKYTLPDNGFTPPEGKVFKAWQVNDREMKPGESLELSENTSIKALWQDEVVPTPAEEGETDQPEETEETMASEKTDTGDNNMPYLWLTLIALSACGLLIVHRSKVNNKDN